MRWSRIVLPVVVMLAAVPAGTAHGLAAPEPEPYGPLAPYFDPPFAGDCKVHSFADGEVPDPADYPDDPLCVEYAKRDITVDNGGAVAFLLGEPARFAMAGDRCGYWQQDHWSVQVSRDDTAIVRWDGSYWFDKGAGQAAGRVSRLELAGEPVDVDRAAELVEPVSRDLADYLRQYSRGGDGMGYSGPVPFDPRCS